MKLASWKEIEYLSAADRVQHDPELVREMSRTLDALRRYEQRVRRADWLPQSGQTGRAGRESD